MKSDLNSLKKITHLPYECARGDYDLGQIRDVWSTEQEPFWTPQLTTQVARICRSLQTLDGKVARMVVLFEHENSIQLRTAVKMVLGCLTRLQVPFVLACTGGGGKAYLIKSLYSVLTDIAWHRVLAATRGQLTGLPELNFEYLGGTEVLLGVGGRFILGSERVKELTSQGVVKIGWLSVPALHPGHDASTQIPLFETLRLGDGISTKYESLNSFLDSIISTVITDKRLSLRMAFAGPCKLRFVPTIRRDPPRLFSFESATDVYMEKGMELAERVSSIVGNLAEQNDTRNIIVDRDAKAVWEAVPAFPITR